MATEPPVLFKVQDTARIITLNRPKKLNALNSEMCGSMFETLNEYSKSELINLVLIKSSSSPRSFCAGGDVATAAQQNLMGNFKDSIDFFIKEYSLNLQLATFNKPIVSFMDGITMGGGVGLAIHSPFRIATENTKWAMPEMDIGFIPDVGVSFALPRVITIANNHCQMALYLCLTGDVINGKDAYLLGLASHFVPSENLVELETRLGEITVPNVIGLNNSRKSTFFDMVDKSIKEYSIGGFDRNFNFSFTADKLDVIESCFDIEKIDTIGDIIKRLDHFEGSAESKQFAANVKNKLLTKSMTSMGVALKLIEENSKDHIESAIQRDLFTAANMCQNEEKLSEFSVAVKHKLVDKIKTSYQWKQNKDLTSREKLVLTSPKPSLPISLLKNTVNVTWNEYPQHFQKYQLPTERILMTYMKNNENKGLTRRNIINYFLNDVQQTKDKEGVEQIIDVILKRRCITEGTTLTWKK